MRLALIGYTYYVRTILRCICYTNPSCIEIYISDIKIAEGLGSGLRCTIGLIDKKIIDKNYVDKILVITSGDFDYSLPDYIAKSKIPRQIIQVNKSPKPVYSRRIFNSSLLQEKPSILCISIGKWSQQYFAELLINKGLSDRKINFYQHFSPETSFILSKLNMLEHKNQSNYELADYDVFVGGVSVNSSNELMYFDSTVSKAIYRTHPDSVIISCNNAPTDLELDVNAVVNILKYHYQVKKIIVLVSEYYYNSNVMFPMKIENYDIIPPYESVCLSTLDFMKNQTIVDQLLAPVYLPDGIFPVKSQNNMVLF